MKKVYLLTMISNRCGERNTNQFESMFAHHYSCWLASLRWSQYTITLMCVGSLAAQSTPTIMHGACRLKCGTGIEPLETISWAHCRSASASWSRPAQATTGIVCSDPRRASFTTFPVLTRLWRQQPGWLSCANRCRLASTAAPLRNTGIQ